MSHKIENLLIGLLVLIGVVIASQSMWGWGVLAAPLANANAEDCRGGGLCYQTISPLLNKCPLTTEDAAECGDILCVEMVVPPNPTNGNNGTPSYDWFCDRSLVRVREFEGWNHGCWSDEDTGGTQCLTSEFYCGRTQTCVHGFDCAEVFDNGDYIYYCKNVGEFEYLEVDLHTKYYADGGDCP